MLPNHKGYFKNRGPRRIAAGKMKVPKMIENRYVLKLRRIIRQVHAEVLRHAHFHQDADHKLTIRQIKALKDIKKGDMTKTADYHAVVMQHHPDPLVVGTKGNWSLTKTGHEMVTAATSEPLDVAGIRIIKAVREPVGAAFDEMVGAVARANKYALATINPSDLRLGSRLQQARDANIALIENAGRIYAQQVREIIDDPANAGKRVEDLADEIYDRGNVSESKAELIARDQTLKMNGQINQIRQENAGVTQYTWSTSHDERVREEHAALDGQVFSWADPPEPGHPGEDFQCRCIALPVFDDDQ